VTRRRAQVVKIVLAHPEHRIQLGVDSVGKGARACSGACCVLGDVWVSPWASPCFFFGGDSPGQKICQEG